MYIDILNFITKKEKSFFSGHIRFGVESNEINNITISNKIDTNAIYKCDYTKELEQLFTDNNFYGTLDFNLNKGTVCSFTYSMTIKGESLVEIIEDDKSCRNVRLVVKKLNT